MKLVTGSRGNFKSSKAIIEGTKGRISEIYLSVENSRFGSGRNYVHEIQLTDISRQVAFARRYNVEYSLAFNTVCFGRDKFTSAFLDDYRRLVEGIESAGVTKIILSDPYLMEITREEYPGMEIIVSVFAEVDSLNKLKFYNRLEVDRIILPHELNRDLEKLRRFREFSKCDLELILNLGCAHYCARGDSHSMFTGHYVEDMRTLIMGDCYTAWCYRHKLMHPHEFLSQDWIRPEDVKKYEEIGIKYFKLAGRATSSTWIIRAANAYLDGKYEGNFFDLITSYYHFTDRMPDEKSPFQADSSKMDNAMKRLMSCGHKCESCSSCEEIFREIMIV
jgi:collagenase-like PrtC family protease